MKKIAALFIILIFFSCNSGKKETNYINQAKRDIAIGFFYEAKTTLKNITKKNIKYDSAQLLIKYCDSMIIINQKREKFVKDSINKVKREQKIKSILKEYNKEIHDLYHFSSIREQFGGSIADLLLEIQYFENIAQKINLYTFYDNKKINYLSNKLKKALIYRQVKEFPTMRFDYAYFINKKLWENDIEVKANGYRTSELEFIGGIFAANKNKQIFEDKIENIAKKFRFKKVNYLWYKYDDNYTSYIIDSKSDRYIEIDY